MPKNPRPMRATQEASAQSNSAILLDCASSEREGSPLAATPSGISQYTAARENRWYSGSFVLSCVGEPLQRRNPPQPALHIPRSADSSGCLPPHRAVHRAFPTLFWKNTRYHKAHRLFQGFLGETNRCARRDGQSLPGNGRVNPCETDGGCVAESLLPCHVAPMRESPSQRACLHPTLLSVGFHTHRSRRE